MGNSFPIKQHMLPLHRRTTQLSSFRAFPLITHLVPFNFHKLSYPDLNHQIRNHLPGVVLRCLPAPPPPSSSSSISTYPIYGWKNVLKWQNGKADERRACLWIQIYAIVSWTTTTTTPTWVTPSITRGASRREVLDTDSPCQVTPGPAEQEWVKKPTDRHQARGAAIAMTNRNRQSFHLEMCVCMWGNWKEENVEHWASKGERKTHLTYKF